MRVIGGEFRSRLLKSLPGVDVRPTPDRLREALFNVLAPCIEGTTFADVYAGTGAVGIEALSRGASRAMFLERSRPAVRVIRENLRALGLDARAEVRHGRAAAMLPEIEADIVFLDPPYRQEREYEAWRLPASARLVIVQHDARRKLAGSYGGLRCGRVLKQGDNALSFYSRRGGDAIEERM
jgi:16S rRNA (guanine966-N2)-methyltransferase